MPPYTPRLLIDISQEQKAMLDTYFPHGLRKLVFCMLIDDLGEMLKEFGPQVLHVIISEKLKFRQVLPSMVKAEGIMEKGDGDGRGNT